MDYLALYIDDEPIGQHLALIRKVCNPESSSKPHITIRIIDEVFEAVGYAESLKIESLNIIEPGQFDPRHGRTTVFIRCESDKLESLEYKVDYPNSDLHLTIYEGKDPVFATELLSLLEQYTWGFELRFNKGKQLIKRGVSSSRTYSKQIRQQISAEQLFLAKRFKSITGLTFCSEQIEQMTAKKKLAIIRKLLDSLSACIKKNGYREVESHYSAETMLPSIYNSALPNDDGITSQLELDAIITPPWLAYRMSKCAFEELGQNNESLRFGDPSVGTGALYRSFFLNSQSLSNKPDISGIGVEINEELAATAYRKWSKRGLTVINASFFDYLIMNTNSKRNVILANPPYLRNSKIDRQLKRNLKEIVKRDLGISINGAAGYYVYFLLMAHSWMDNDCVAVWLIPEEFLRSNYGASIREYLSSKVELKRVHLFDYKKPQFEKVRTLNALVVFRNRVPADDSTTLFTVGDFEEKPKKSYVVKRSDLAKNANEMLGWGQLVESRRNGEDKRDYITLDMIFNIKRGIATGAHEWFIIPKERAESLCIPRTFQKPILPKGRYLTSSIVEEDSDGHPKTEPQLILIDCSLSEAELRDNEPKLNKYLQTAAMADARGGEKKVIDGNLIRSRHPWYKQEKREPCPYYCTTFGRKGFRFIWNKSSAIVSNSYHILYPNANLSRFLKEHKEFEGNLFELLQKIETSEMEMASRLHAEGLRKIEPRNLSKVRMYDPPKWLVELTQRNED